MENTTTTTTTAQLKKAFNNAKLNDDLERAIYNNGRDSAEAKRKGIRLDTNNASMIDDLIAQCKKVDDFTAIERIGLKHKTYDLRDGYLGLDNKTPESCKAFKTAVGKAFDRAYQKDPTEENLKTLQGCGMGGVPKVGAKKKPKTKKPEVTDQTKGGDKIIDICSEDVFNQDAFDKEFDTWEYTAQQHFISNLLKRSKAVGKVVNS